MSTTNIRAVPLVNSWSAHPYLISPLTFGLYTQHSHLAMLDSFIEDPQLHRTSVQTPALRGGPFIDYPHSVDDIRRFRVHTAEKCALQLHAADAVNSLYQLVQNSAKGVAVVDLYSKIDELIRYGVEIFYDVCKQPCVRFIESLFYQSAVYDSSFQSCLVEPVTNSSRSFVLSTPQLRRGETSIGLKVPFRDPLWDELLGDRQGTPALLEKLRERVEDPVTDMPILQRMLSASAQSQGEPEVRDRESVRVRYFGHACVLLEYRDVSILVDPLVSYAGESSLDRFTFDDLPNRIDYVLITHPHQDHVVLETLLKIRSKIGRLIVGRSGGGLQDVSLKLMLQSCGFDCITELAEYESIEFGEGRIVAAPFYGEHADLDIRSKLAYGVELRGVTCAFFADSNPPAPEFYEPLKTILSKVDCLFLGMECVGAPASWLYGPVLQKILTRGEDQSRRLDGCNAARALKLCQYFQPQRAYVYAMGAEPWLTHLTSILYSEESIQFKEARSFEKSWRSQGYFAEVLFGKMDLIL